MIIFGVRKSDLGTVPSKNCACPSCGNYGSINYSAEGKYFHVFWVPTIPVRKKGYTACSDCDYLVWNKELPDSLIQEYNFLKSQLKFPWWYYSGIVVLTLFISWFAYRLNQDKKDELEYLTNPKVEDVYSLKTGRGVYTNMKLVRIESDSLYFFLNTYQAVGLKGIKKLLYENDYRKDTVRYSKQQIVQDYHSDVIRGISRYTKN